MCIVNCGRRIFDGTGQEIQGMDDAVAFGRRCLREVVVDKFEGFGEE